MHFVEFLTLFIDEMHVFENLVVFKRCYFAFHR